MIKRDTREPIDDVDERLYNRLCSVLTFRCASRCPFDRLLNPFPAKLIGHERRALIGAHVKGLSHDSSGICTLDASPSILRALASSLAKLNGKNSNWIASRLSMARYYVVVVVAEIISTGRNNDIGNDGHSSLVTRQLVVYRD